MILELARRLWLGWGAFTRGLFRAQNALAMTLAWVIAIAPAGVILRLLGRDLLDAGPSAPRTSHWRARADGPLDMKRASRMY